MNTKEVLIKVRELLSDRSHWTQGASARIKKGGKLIPVIHENATCWCLTGAVKKVILENQDTDIHVANYEVLDSIQRCLNSDKFKNVVQFNDSRSTRHPMVLKVLDCAIESEG